MISAVVAIGVIDAAVIDAAVIAIGVIDAAVVAAAAIGVVAAVTPI